MPTVTMALDQKNISLRRSAELSIIKQLIKKSGFPSDAYITLNEDQGGVKSRRSNTDSCQDPVMTKHNNFVFVKSTERFTESGVMYNRNMEKYRRPVFHNRDTNIVLYPTYGQVETSFEIEFRTRDLSTMNNWLLAMRARQGIKHLLKTHDVIYDYSIPDDIALFMYETYLMTERVDGYGIDYKTYLDKYMLAALEVRSNLTKTHKQAVIIEKQNGCRALHTDPMPYEPVQTEEGVYSLTVSYKVIYDQITALRLSFPLFIHNQMVDYKYIEAWTLPYGIVNETGYKSGQWIYDNMLRTDFERYYRGDGGSRMVEYDDYFPRNPRREYRTVFLTPVQVSDTDANYLPAIGDIPNGKIPDVIGKYIKAFHHIGFNYRDGPICIELYETDAKERRLELNITPEGVMSTKAPMVRRNQNYLMVSVTTDLSWIDGKTMKDLMDNPDIFIKIIELIDPGATHGTLPDVKRGDVDILITPAGKVDDKSVYDWMTNGHSKRGISKTRYGESHRVSTATLIARRKR